MKGALLLGLPKDDSKDESDSEPDLEGLADTMRDLGQALRSKDWGAAATAFRTACMTCMDDDEDQPDEE